MAEKKNFKQKETFSILDAGKRIEERKGEDRTREWGSGGEGAGGLGRLLMMGSWETHLGMA